MKQILCVICFDTKWLSVLFKTVIIQSDDHNVPHYAYKTTAHVQLQPILQTDTTHTVVVTSPGLRQYRSY